MKNLLKTLLLLLVVGWSATCAAVTFEAGKFYSIKNVEASKHLTLDQGTYTETSAVNATPLTTAKGYFIIEPGSDNTYSLKSGDYYMSFSTDSKMTVWNTGRTATASSVWSIEPVSGTTDQYYIRSTKGYLKFDGINSYAYTNGAVGDGNKAKWVITEEQSNSATVICYDDDNSRELQRETVSFFETSKSVSAPAITGYDAKPPTTATVTNGKEVTFHYTLHHYTVTYDYYNVETPDVKHDSESFSLTYGTALPTPNHSCSGRELIGAPTGKVTSDVTYRIYCLDPSTAVEVKETANITYTYYGNGELWFTGTPKEAVVGEAYPTLDADLPATVSATRPAGAVTKPGDYEVRINVSATAPFEFSSSFDATKARWYKLQIGKDRRYFNYTANAANMVLAPTADDSDKYLFAFVGNPFDGYKIYNRAAGSNMVLSAPAPSTASGVEGKNACPVMKTLPVAADYNTAWDVEAKGSGFLLSRHGEGYFLNRRQDIVNGSQVLSFWTNANAHDDDAGSLVYASEYVPGETTVTTNPAGVAPTAGKVYRIYNNGVPGRMITETEDNALFMSNKKADARLSQMWVLHQNGDGYSLMNAETGRYIQPANAATTTTTATKLYLPTANYSTNRFSISAAADASGKTNLNTNSTRTDVLGWSMDANSAWIFEEVLESEISIDAIKDHIRQNSTYVALTPSAYYRLSNKAYASRYMIDEYTDNHGVAGRLSDEVPSQSCQIWQIVAEGDKFFFRNAFTGRYIADQGNQSRQFLTVEDADVAKRFTLQTAGGDDWTAPSYAFSRGVASTGAEAYSLHCASSQSNTVVAWTYVDAPASYWNLEPVDLAADDLAAMAEEYNLFIHQNEIIAELNAHAEEYNAKLLRYFADLACTEIAPSFKRLTNAQLKAILANDGLPEALQQMVVNVKNESWEIDPERNRFTKLFRINDYEIYTDRGIWGTKTGVGPFAMFCNPTGVTVRVGEPVYIFVNEPPADADVKVGMYVAKDTEYRSDAYVELHAGLNIWSAPKDGELIVDYRLANANKKWTDYKPLRVHIEGGRATGCWDATRNMTDADWQWLCDNAFEARFLHVKGNMTMLNLLTSDAVQARGERVSAIMQGWDYAFDGLQRMIGHDGQWDGYYRPMINPRHSYQGNPNWGGQSGSNHPTLARNGYLFRESNFTKDNIWEILHEEGHGHQGPINVAGSTEITNNSLSQMVSYELGVNYSRGENGAGHVELFNYQQGEHRGWSWVDYMRYATPYYDYSLHIGNQLLFRLYLYFKVTGIMPDFMPRLYDELRANGGIRKGNSVANPTIWTNDYMKLALACCKVSQTDLSEFFETYGMFKYYEDVMSYREQDNDATAQAQHIRYIGDYGGYYMKMPSKNVPEDIAAMEACIAEMKSYTRKGDNIMFIEDRIETDYVKADALMAQIDPTIVGTEKRKYWTIGSQGDFGQYTDYATPPAASGIDYTISTATATQTVKAVDTAAESTILGRTVTIQGEGLCGVKIYDKDGKLIYIANTRSFFVPTDVATKLQSGDCTLVVALPDMSSVPLFKGEIGDMNFDGRITIDDVAILIKALNVTKWPEYDLNDVNTLRGKVLSK